MASVPEEPVPESCWGRSILISMQWNARKTGNRKITFGYFEWIGKHFCRFCRAKIRLIRNGKSRNYVTRVGLGDALLRGGSVGTLLHMPSSCFYVDDSEEILRITVKGNGHGFGISLYTADRMIREGMSWEEVIQKFYENAECITLF